MKITKDKAKEIRKVIEDALKEVYNIKAESKKQKEFYELCEERIHGISLKSGKE